MNQPKYKDGNYTFEELESSFDKDFESERDLCDYVESNIESFVSDCLGYSLKEYKRECSVSDYGRRKKGNRRIDFLIETECGKKIGIECKNPIYISELSNAIGQCLTYITLFEKAEIRMDKVIILSTTIDWVLPAVISRFNLPIGFISFDKGKFATYIGDGK